MPVASPRMSAARCIQYPMAVPPPASNFLTAALAAFRVSTEDTASGDDGGYTTSAL